VGLAKYLNTATEDGESVAAGDLLKRYAAAGGGGGGGRGKRVEGLMMTSRERRALSHSLMHLKHPSFLRPVRV
jgi:hypothetical protein